jgi:general secretion pathway protein M
VTTLPLLAGRVAALGLAAGVLTLVIAGALVPFANRLADLDEQKRIAAGAVERLVARIGDREGFAERLTALEQEVAASKTHIEAETPALGSAVMQQLLAAAAARHGIQVASVQVLPGTAEAGFQRIALRADVQGPLPGMTGLLHDLESGRPYMFVEAIDIQSHTTTSESEHPLVSVRTDLVSYMREPER